MRNTVQESFEYIISTLRIFGLYPSKHLNIFLKLGAYVLFLMWQSIMVLTGINIGLGNNSNTLQFNLSVIVFMTGTAVSLKLIIFFINRKRIEKCVEFLAHFTLQNAEERKILDESVRICKKVTSFYMGVVVVALTLWIFQPLLQSQNQLFVNIWLPYDPRTSSLKFYLTYAYMTLSSYCGGICGLVIDPLLGGLAYHVTAHIKNLKHILKNIPAYAESESNEDLIRYKKVSRVLKRCVKYDNDIFQFIDEYENCFSWLIFSQVAASTIGLCFCSVGIQNSDVTRPDGLTFIFSYAVMIFQIFFYCFFGTLLCEEYKYLSEAIYMGPWYRYDKRVRKVLILIMERSKRPLVITAGKIITLTLTTFAAVLKTSYSMIAVLNSFTEEQFS